MVVARVDYNVIVIYFRITTCMTLTLTLALSYMDMMCVMYYVIIFQSAVFNNQDTDWVIRSRSLISAMAWIRVQHFSYVGI